MGLFEDIGRKVETFKQQAESHSHEQARAKCSECETLVYTDREDCPECGHQPLLVRKSENEGDDETVANDEGSDETEADDETVANDEGSDEKATDGGSDPSPADRT